jgi:hypothetical protein
VLCHVGGWQGKHIGNVERSSPQIDILTGPALAA